MADLMGSLLIVVPAAFGIVFAYWLYKKLCRMLCNKMCKRCT